MTPPCFKRPIVAGAVWALCVAAAVSPLSFRSALSQTMSAVHTSRQQLVGTWQLVSVQVVGPKGRQTDPFYNADPTGVLIYDASGWMSVQIASQPRPSLEVHAARSGAAHAAQDAQLEAAVLDTYYAYAATWDFDEATSKVSHHVKFSLIPGETGKSYTQSVQLDGSRLIFTTQREDLGKSMRQEKVWQRIEARTEAGRGAQ